MNAINAKSNTYPFVEVLLYSEIVRSICRVNQFRFSHQIGGDLAGNININPEYVQCIDSLDVICTQYAHDDIIICGDWNTSFERDNFQTKTMNEFLDRNELCVTWNHPLAKKSNTYVYQDLTRLPSKEHLRWQ